MIRNLRTLLNGLRNVRSRVFRLAVECLRLAQRLDWPSPGVQAPPITVDRPLRRYFPPSRVSANWRNSEIRGEPRTNHQSVMECGRFRPTHPVEHHALELEQFRFFWNFPQRGISSCTRMRAELCRALAARRDWREALTCHWRALRPRNSLPSIRTAACLRSVGIARDHALSYEKTFD